MIITALKTPEGFSVTAASLSHDEAEALVVRLLAMAEKSEVTPS